MKKFITKKAIIAICISSMIISTALTSNATSYSGWLSSPSTTAGYQYTVGPSYALSSSSSPAQGSNTFTYFSDLGTLQTNFISSNLRGGDLWLNEDDILFNDDVKFYSLHFSGRTISSIDYVSTLTSGSIEPDANAELFIDFWITKLTGDPTNPTIASGIFKYNMGINWSRA